MKTITKLFISLLLGTTLLQGIAFEKTISSSATQIILSSVKPLSTGNNTLLLEIMSEDYKDSDVSLKVFMPAMPGMPYMQSISKVKNIGSGKYTTNINVSMRGTWQVHIFVTPKTGKKVRIKTSFNI